MLVVFFVLLQFCFRKLKPFRPLMIVMKLLCFILQSLLFTGKSTLTSMVLKCYYSCIFGFLERQEPVVGYGKKDRSAALIMKSLDTTGTSNAVLFSLLNFFR